MKDLNMLERYFNIIREFFNTFPGISLTDDLGIYTRPDTQENEGRLEAELDSKEFPSYHHPEKKTFKIIKGLQNTFQEKGIEATLDDLNFGLSIKNENGTFLITVTALFDIGICSIIQQ